MQVLCHKNGVATNRTFGDNPTFSVREQKISLYLRISRGFKRHEVSNQQVHHQAVSLSNVSGVFTTEFQSISTSYTTPREDKPAQFSLIFLLKNYANRCQKSNYVCRYRDQATGWTIQGLHLGRGTSVLQYVCTGCTAYPAYYSVGKKVTAAVKRPGPELNHSSPCSAKVKNEWNCTSIPSQCPHDVDREGFTFTYYHGCTALQTVKSRDRFPLVSYEFFIDIILAAALWPWG